MSSTILKILMTLFVLQALIKFYVFFFVRYEVRRKQLDKSYGQKASATKYFDNVILLVLALLVTLLFLSKSMEYLSFITGVYIGATLIQVYFHRFSDPLPEDKSPKPPISPIKIMSYGVQAFPKKPWKELLFLTLIFLWGLYMLLSRGFGLI
ncbi:MAG: hypothetical protein C5B59_13540 [Bacteroidetes bacterium]|nr:MAG: hypothetical protein C5B59_13540 [Bacteroidota bacterium]